MPSTISPLHQGGVKQWLTEDLLNFSMPLWTLLVPFCQQSDILNHLAKAHITKALFILN